MNDRITTAYARGEAPTLDRWLALAFVVLTGALAMGARAPLTTAIIGLVTGMGILLFSSLDGQLFARRRHALRRLGLWIRPLLTLAACSALIVAIGPQSPGWLVIFPFLCAMAFTYEGHALPFLQLVFVGVAATVTWMQGTSTVDTVIAVVALATIAGLAFVAVRELAKGAGELRDTTKRLLCAEQARASATLEAQQSARLASVGRLAAGVAHEVNNPLTVVLSNIECLETSHRNLGGLAEVERSDLRLITREIGDAAKRVRRIVGDVKAFSRVHHDDQSVAIDIQTLVEGSIRMVHHQLCHRARLIRDYKTCPPVIGDPTRLGQVFVNLLINAIQAIPEGDVGSHEIKISTGPCAPDRVFIELHDTGVGIPHDDLDRIFDPFFTSKPVGKGTGLGLSIVHGIVARMGGDVEVQSTPGRGTTFRLVLPAASGNIVETRRPSPSGPHSSRGKRNARVLIIDDEELVLESLARTLRPHKVTTMVNGAEALRFLEGDDNFDLILCDLMMPAMSGIEFHAQITQRFAHLLPCTVIMTGGAFTSEAEAFLARLETPCLEKPFSGRDVRKLIEESLGAAHVASIDPGTPPNSDASPTTRQPLH